jgi:hypothetical protein
MSCSAEIAGASGISTSLLTNRPPRHDLGRGFLQPENLLTMQSRRQPDVPTGRHLIQTAPRLYIDEAGAQYFYLTGMYSVIVLSLCGNPRLNTPESMVSILGELRMELCDMYRIELLD